MSISEMFVYSSVLCPGWVNTRIMDSERNRPEKLQNDLANAPLSPEAEAASDEMARAVETGMSPKEVAERVFHAIREEKFYILTHPEFRPAIQARMEDILEERNPRSPLPPQD